MTDPEWLSPAEGAAALGVHPNTVRHWVRREYLPSERHTEPHEIGPPRYRIRRADVRAFAERHDTGKPRPTWVAPTEPGLPSSADPPRSIAPDGAADALMTLPQVAARTGLPIDTIRRWSAVGRIVRRDPPALKRQAWVRWSDVRAFGEVYYHGKPRPAWLDEA